MTMANPVITSLHDDLFNSRNFERAQDTQHTELEKPKTKNDAWTIEIPTLADIAPQRNIQFHEGTNTHEDTDIWVDSIPLSIEIEPIGNSIARATQIPIVLKMANAIFGVLSIFFVLQFILAFFNKALINGFVALVGGVGFSGLLHVFSRAANVIKKKQYGRFDEVSQ